jgi:YD repeat-containing protein
LYAVAPNTIAVYGDGGQAGIFGKTQRGIGVVAASDTGFGLWARTRSASNPAGYFQGNVVIQGNLIVSGIKNAAVPRAGGKHQLLYCLESPRGKVTGRTSTSGSTTTIYDPAGRNVGRFTTNR